MHVASWWFLGMHAFWWVFWIVLLVWAYRYAVSRLKQLGQRDTSLAALQRRYAAGELSTQEYEERKARLESSTDELGDG